MTSHTSAPWLMPHFARPDIECNCGYVLSPNYMGAIATVHFEGEKPGVYDDNPPMDEAIANARLIAAAPDLLNIARRWAALEGGSWNTERLARETDALLADTVAAIAKATGGSHD